MKYLALILALISSSVIAEDVGYSMVSSKDKVSYVFENSNNSVALSILEPRLGLATTKDYAQYIMDSYQGFALTPQIDLRGFSFKYVDNAPCTGLLTFFDGRSYLLYESCGDLSEDKLKSLFLDAKKILKLEERLQNQAHPSGF